jgi:hypothetical protein
MVENPTTPTTDVKTIAVGGMQVKVSGTGLPLILLHGFTTTSELSH